MTPTQYTPAVGVNGKPLADCSAAECGYGPTPTGDLRSAHARLWRDHVQALQTLTDAQGRASALKIAGDAKSARIAELELEAERLRGGVVDREKWIAELDRQVSIARDARAVLAAGVERTKVALADREKRIGELERQVESANAAAKAWCSGAQDHSFVPLSRELDAAMLHIAQLTEELTMARAWCDTLARQADEIEQLRDELAEQRPKRFEVGDEVMFLRRLREGTCPGYKGLFRVTGVAFSTGRFPFYSVERSNSIPIVAFGPAGGAPYPARADQLVIVKRAGT